MISKCRKACKQDGTSAARGDHDTHHTQEAIVRDVVREGEVDLMNAARGDPRDPAADRTE